MAGISRDAVLRAIREYDELGSQSFLDRYGFTPSRRFVLMHGGRSYDSKAILGAASGFRSGDNAPLRWDEFSGGEEAVSRLKELGFQVRDLGAAGLGEEARAIWIFQANPKSFDLQGALRELPNVTFTVRQYGRQVQVGDEVYLWQAGPDAGVLARATVLTEPADLELPEDQRVFVRRPDELQGLEPRVWLRVERILDAPLAS